LPPKQQAGSSNLSGRTIHFRHITFLSLEGV
jgi:hypothetical protein